MRLAKLVASLCLAVAPLNALAQTADDPTPGFFAIGSCAANSRNHNVWLPKMTAIGVHDLRSFGGGWGGVEPEPGQFTFVGPDARYEYLKSIGVRPGITLQGSPKWNTKDVQGGLPMNNLEGWSNYVSKTVEHFKGRVTYYEIWNEPPNGTKNAPPEDYGKLVAAAYTAAKKVDPNCKIGIATKSVHVNYLDRAIQGGAKDHFDYITLHPYETLGCVMAHPGTEQVFMQITPTVRKMLAAQNPAKKDVPIIFTELGFDSKRGADKQSYAIVKANMMAAYQGIATIHWFEAMDGDSGPMGMMDGKLNTRPAYKAYAEMIRLIGQRPKPIGFVLLNDKHYGFVFQGTSNTVMATWAATSAADEIDFGQSVKIIDPATGESQEAAKYTLTSAPILIDGVPEKLVAQAKANNNKPFPWGGDYTAAKSVSVTFGEKNVEKGLHTQSADSVAADVIAYGGNARSGSVPGGNVFIVDSNFLSYTSTPVEITAVVRRNEKNDPAKLELEYESTVGHKKLPPIEIPESNDWQPITWKLNDTQFVGMYAYSFRLNKGTYAVQSVTVTKIGK